MVKQIALLVQAALVLTVLLCCEVTAVGPEGRLVPTQPTEGRYVKTDHGFMIPYEQRIPGSNAVIKMVPIPGGSITIAPLPPQKYHDHSSGKLESEKTPAGKAKESPRTVAITPFWIGKYEITMDQYMPYRRLYYQQKKDEFKKVNQADAPSDVDAVTGPTEVYAPKYNFEYAGLPDSPVPTASQFACRQYTKYLSLLTEQEYRLPLRSEWQHACLAGSTSKYCFGNDAEQLGQYAVYTDSDHKAAVPLRVGQRKPNAWGLYDVHGNVSELVIEDTAPSGMHYGHPACGGNLDSDAEDCTATSLQRTTIEWWDDDPDFPQSSWWMTSVTAQLTGFRIIAPLTPMSAEQKTLYWDADSEELTMDVQSRLDDGRGSLGRVSPPKPTTRRVVEPGND